MFKNPERIKEQFLLDMKNAGSLELLFDYIPDLAFWVKNSSFQFVMGNRTVVKLCGCENESDFIGKMDSDFFPFEICQNFRKDDEAILAGKEEIRNRVEMIPDWEGKLEWYSTNKVPLFGHDGNVIGITGITRKNKIENILEDSSTEMSNVFKYIYDNYSRPIDIKDLAKMSGFSISQFEKKIKNLLQISPIKFIISVRLKEACKLLIATEDSLSTISHETGFYDQSTFSKYFKNVIGILPSKYRRIYQKKQNI